LESITSHAIDVDPSEHAISLLRKIGSDEIAMDRIDPKSW
jgi:hypothetical protein